MPELRESDKQEIAALLNNIAKGINTVGIRRLNTALCSVLFRDSEKNNSVEIVTAAVCDNFGVSPGMLKNSTHEKALRARRVLICLLHFELGLSTRAISKAVIGRETNSHAAVYQIIKRYRNPNLSVRADAEFKQAYDKIFNSIKNNLNHNL